MKYLLLAFAIIYSAIGNAQHRKHVLGMVFSTSPPYLSCIYCGDEINVRNLLPMEYDTMKVPIKFSESDTMHFYTNGYYKFLNYLENKGISADSFFMARWNALDTSCISSEIAANKSRAIGDSWLKTHKKGTYWLNKFDYMNTSGSVGRASPESSYIMGGRFDDSTLLADKWYKVVLDKPKKTKIHDTKKLR